MAFPWALARARPSAVRVRIRSRSTSARPPSTASIKRPVLLVLSAHGSASERHCALASTMHLTIPNDGVVGPGFHRRRRRGVQKHCLRLRKGQRQQDRLPEKRGTLPFPVCRSVALRSRRSIDSARSAAPVPRSIRSSCPKLECGDCREITGHDHALLYYRNLVTSLFRHYQYLLGMDSDLGYG